jgi:hypothetical protein
VSVLVIDWTMIGAEPPTITPPTFTATERCRAAGAAVFVITLLQAHHAECQTVARHVNGFMTDCDGGDDPFEIYYETRCRDTPLLRREASPRPSMARWFGGRHEAMPVPRHRRATPVDCGYKSRHRDRRTGFSGEAHEFRFLR